jgi:hypothetical protein
MPSVNAPSLLPSLEPSLLASTAASVAASDPASEPPVAPPPVPPLAPDPPPPPDPPLFCDPPLPLIPAVPLDPALPSFSFELSSSDVHPAALADAMRAVMAKKPSTLIFMIVLRRFRNGANKEDRGPSPKSIYGGGPVEELSVVYNGNPSATPP